MQKQNFTRSNVNESTLNISAPLRSGFNLSHRDKGTLKLGVLQPINIEYLTPTDMFRGKVGINLQLEKIMTPELGRLRLDTHNYLVHARRINKDWREFAESSRDFNNIQSKPKFGFYSLVSQLFATLQAYEDSDTGGRDVVENTEFLGSEYAYPEVFPETPVSGTDYWAIFVERILYKAKLSYSTLLNLPDYGYMRDFILMEIKRLDGLTPPTVADAIMEVLRPYFGVSSIMDMIGYPILRSYSRWYEGLKDIQVKDTTGSQLQTMNEWTFIQLFTLNPGSGYLPIENYFDEMPLRAIYAAWYDDLRNYHVEKRTNILDPDNFGKDSILAKFVSSYSLGNNLLDVMQLLLPKFRMYSRDGLTTIQEDDIYRHVYAPIYDSAQDIKFDAIDSDNDDVVQKALSIIYDTGFGLNNGSYVPFLSDLFNRNNLRSGQEQTGYIYMLDLQTMKRAGMLQRMLARDYYNPDTYAGYIMSRYSTEPADIDFLVSRRLNSSEQYIDGKQEVANVTTDYTPAGQRIFTGGASINDEFSYRCTDYAYVVSFASLLPQVVYDAANMHAHELTPFDLPMPEFADDTRVSILRQDVLRDHESADEQGPLGFVPRYYGYRARLDAAHGEYLTDKRTWLWLRDWYNMQTDDVDGGFELNAYQLRVHLPLDSFLGNLHQWDSIAYGEFDFMMAIDRPLPAAVENI